MFQRKVCMLGTFAVGKTSLVARFVSGLFSDEYLTTIGVKVDRKVVEVEGQSLRLLLWDIAGDDAFQRLRGSYLRGAAGALLVADGTRAHTLEHALALEAELPPGTPTVVLLNKRDLRAEWEVSDDRLDALRDEGRVLLETSAKSGEGVEAAFEALARALLADDA